MKLSMKWVTLLLLVMQTVASVMMIRLASVQYVGLSNTGEAAGGKADGSPVRFLKTTVVALAEVFKFVASFVVLWAETGFTHPVETLTRLRSCLFARPVDTLKLGVPALLYTLQNNLVFVALANLSGAVYQVTYQFKILTTAVLSVLILGKRLSSGKWTSLMLLTLGVILIQLATLRTPWQAPQAAETRGLKNVDLRKPVTSVAAGDLSSNRVSPLVAAAVVERVDGRSRTGAAEGPANKLEDKGRWSEQGKRGPVTKSGDMAIGLAAVIAACFTSAFAGVYLEKLLQETPVSIWVRNIQLAAFGILFGFTTAYWSDGDRLQADGFFQGYTPLVWVILLLQGVGGLIVAAVLKYADNILKCFGNASSILLSCLLSWWVLGDYYPTPLFCVGAALVIFATCAYTVDVFMLVDFITGRDAAVRHHISCTGPASESASAAPVGQQRYLRVSTQISGEVADDREMSKKGSPTCQCVILPLETAK